MQTAESAGTPAGSATGAPARIVSLHRDFSFCPGPRLRKAGTNSAEEFVETKLLPAFAGSEFILLDLDGTAGVAASFLDEIMLRLIAHFGPDEAARRLSIKTDEEPHLLDNLVQTLSDHLEIAGRARDELTIRRNQ
jgi:hypothetical protein